MFPLRLVLIFLVLVLLWNLTLVLVLKCCSWLICCLLVFILRLVESGFLLFLQWPEDSEMIGAKALPKHSPLSSASP